MPGEAPKPSQLRQWDGHGGPWRDLRVEWLMTGGSLHLERPPHPNFEMGIGRKIVRRSLQDIQYTNSWKVKKHVALCLQLDFLGEFVKENVSLDAKRNVEVVSFRY